MTHFICGQVPLLLPLMLFYLIIIIPGARAAAAAAGASVYKVIHLVSLWSRSVSDRRKTRHCLIPIASAWHSRWLRTLVGFAPQGFSCSRQVALPQQSMALRDILIYPSSGVCCFLSISIWPCQRRRYDPKDVAALRETLRLTPTLKFAPPVAGEPSLTSLHLILWI